MNQNNRRILRESTISSQFGASPDTISAMSPHHTPSMKDQSLKQRRNLRLRIQNQKDKNRNTMSISPNNKTPVIHQRIRNIQNRITNRDSRSK